MRAPRKREIASSIPAWSTNFVLRSQSVLENTGQVMHMMWMVGAADRSDGFIRMVQVRFLTWTPISS
jgi:hypothetical protein